MAGWERAPKTAAEGADTAVWLETLPKEKQLENSGKFFQERKEFKWWCRDKLADKTSLFKMKNETRFDEINCNNLLKKYN